MRDALVVVDLFQDFGHEDGERLLASLASRRDAIASVLEDARRSEVPVVFVNDHPGVWDSDARRIVADALSGPGGEQLRLLVPQPGERIVLKPRYSAFDHTPLAVVLESLECERVVLVGMTTEGCVASRRSMPASSDTESRSCQPPAERPMSFSSVLRSSTSTQ